MKRPADQAKLLFFYLLRSSAAALATTSSAGTGNTAAKLLLPPQPQGHICLRLARRSDVVPIQRCNFATLPENYNANFYERHLKQYPDLALVAEHVPVGAENNQSTRRFHNPAFPGLKSQESKIVGYVLGKVDVMRQPPVTLNGGGYGERQSMKTLGHVISLAVMHDYRRHGLAAALMNQLHFQMEQGYGANSVGLHVRKSNEAAWKLYERDGYIVHNIIPRYYEDGEDAYFMQKPLRPLGGAEMNSSKRGWGARTRPWENGPLEYRLPRDQAFRNVLSVENPPDGVSNQQGSHVITGTM